MSQYKCRNCAYESRWDFGLKHHLKVCRLTSDPRFGCSRPVEAYKCRGCGFRSALKVSLMAHLEEGHDPLSIPAVEAEAKAAESVEEYKCENCDFETSSQLLLVNHMQNEYRTNLSRKRNKDGPKPARKRPSLETAEKYNCDNCSFVTSSQLDLISHMRKEYKARLRRVAKKQPPTCHETEKKHKCDRCDFATPSPSVLGRHRRLHLKDESAEEYKCENCDFVTTSQLGLIEHMREEFAKSRRAEDPLNTTKNLEQPRNPRRAKKPPRNAKSDARESCALTSTPQSSSTKRKRRDAEEYGCEDCDFVTTSQLDLIAHMRQRCKARTGRKKDASKPLRPGENGDDSEGYKCENCDFVASSQLDFILHVREEYRARSKPTDGKCDKCGFATTSQLVLVEHMRTTCPAKIARFEGARCPYGSRAEDNLKQHLLRKHQPLDRGARFDCDSKSKGSLKIHVRHQHTAPQDVERFKCDQCPYTSKTKGTLRRHRQRVHDWSVSNLCLQQMLHEMSGSRRRDK